LNKKAQIISKAGLITFIIVLVVVFLVVGGFMGFALIKEKVCPACSCPECPPCDVTCPQPEGCPDCNPQVKAECPQPICPSICNISQKQVDEMSDKISSTKCIPSDIQRISLFTIIMALVTILIAYAGTKNPTVALLASVAYIAIIIFMFFMKYSDYAMIGLIIYLTVMFTKFILPPSEREK